MQRGIALGIKQGVQAGQQEGREKGLALGRAEGREEGRAEGRLVAARQLLSSQLAKRFGTLDTTLKLRIEAASMEELERWCLAVVTARTIDEVF